MNSGFTINALGQVVYDLDPSAIHDFGIRLTRVLKPGDSVQSVEGFPVGLLATNVATDGTVVAARLQPTVAAGQPASMTWRFTTVDGERDDKTLHFNIREG